MRSCAAGVLAFALCMGVPAYSQDIVCQNATIGVSPDGSLQDLCVDQTRIIKQGAYLLCEPVAADGTPIRTPAPRSPTCSQKASSRAR
jgi:hypothetical protein